MKSWKLFALSSFLVLGQNANAYNVVDRYRLVEDKLKTEQMLRPLGHDFLLDVGAAANKNVTDFIDDIDEATKFEGNDAEQLANAQMVLAKWDKTEQTVGVKLAIGFPLPSFTAFSVAFKPNFRITADVGANIGIRSETITVADLVDLFPVELPADLRAFVLTLQPNDDVIVECLAEPSLSASTKTLCATFPTGRYIIPSTTEKLPFAAVYGKADAKAGFFNDYTYGEHWFGQFNLYGMGRADFFQIVTSTQIASGEGVETPDKMNTEVTLQSDYRLGYKNTNYSVFLGVEEIKLAKLKEREEGSKELTYEYDPLLRLHADATFRYLALSIQPFVGVHKRTGYSVGDGTYGGATAGAFVWGDRLGLQMTGMMDKQYLTLTPRIKLWLMQLEYSLKKPLKDTVDDVKLTAIHSLDFRLFF